jgi:hypothetical protein
MAVDVGRSLDGKLDHAKRLVGQVGLGSGLGPARRDNERQLDAQGREQPVSLAVRAISTCVIDAHNSESGFGCHLSTYSESVPEGNATIALAAHGLLVERTSADVVAALRTAEIPSILLKGPLQQRWLVAAGPPRASADVDVLVSRVRMSDAGAVLTALGYGPKESFPEEAGREHSEDWVASRRVPVELHFSLVGMDERRVWEVLAAETEPAELMGQLVDIPNEPARCLIVALHAAQHGVGQQGVFDDLEKALVVADTGAWRRALALAAAVDATTPFAAALSLTERGTRLLGELGVEPPVLSEREALSLLTPADTALGFYLFSAERGATAKAAFVARKLVPAPSVMRLRYPIARRGRLGMTAAYLYRPIWIVRLGPQGLRSWRRARRLARASEDGRWSELVAGDKKTE